MLLVKKRNESGTLGKSLHCVFSFVPLFVTNKDEGSTLWVSLLLSFPYSHHRVHGSEEQKEPKERS
jgi:hypothetical protein